MPRLSATTALRLVDSIAIALGQAYQLVRVRLASAGSPMLRLLVQRDEEVTASSLLRRQLAVMKGQREDTPPHQRREYSPAQRLEILQIQRLRGWTLAQTAQQFVVHVNTLRHWAAAAEGRGSVTLLTGAVVWNKIDDAVRWAVQELRRLCPEPEFGTRSMARELLHAAIQISRSSVQRILRESPPDLPEAPATATSNRKPPMEPPANAKPHHLLTPKCINHVWHLDFTRIQILWWTFWIGAILDGFSRKLLTLRVYRHTPGTRESLRLVRRTIREHGKPKFVITDHGCQFRDRFHDALEKELTVHHVRGRVRAPYLNGKLERAFRTFKLWWRLVLTGYSTACIQRRLDVYQDWYNTVRIHSALGVRTPEETWTAKSAPEPQPLRAADPQRFQIQVSRSQCRGDPRLRVLQITLRRAA